MCVCVCVCVVCVCVCCFAQYSDCAAHIIFRPHRSTTYVDAAAYCYRPSSVVCRSVFCLSVFLSVTLVSTAKTAAPIEMPFGLRIRVGPRNNVLDGGADPHMGRGNFEGGSGVPL